jgi:hypothetical protein
MASAKEQWVLAPVGQAANAGVPLQNAANEAAKIPHAPVQEADQGRSRALVAFAAPKEHAGGMECEKCGLEHRTEKCEAVFG